MILNPKYYWILLRIKYWEWRLKRLLKVVSEMDTALGSGID